MTSARELGLIRGKLRQTRVQASDDWVREGTAFVRGYLGVGETGSVELVVRELRAQWLLSDLRAERPRQGVFEADGSIRLPALLQMNSVFDVGKPALEQLNKLTNQENANAAVQATDNQPAPVCPMLLIWLSAYSY